MKTYNNKLFKVATGALVMFSTLVSAQTVPASEDIRPFKVSIPEKKTCRS
ncbi:hypothetical protein [Pedobacter rhizosphaerae]|uniref:Uncharacterized protein n=1 Tax=Pedobacter rhizosphaerae TaxID=390241 RepID=A0A1H9QVM9_9SPHI|nr:hypothetical protein [Pedobacter rhizosphaerae]SER64506.1 hypothetical protein SAMN04488023_1134 [Pedobacter rhizosphaerae]